jgi:hypothetical protein
MLIIYENVSKLNYKYLMTTLLKKIAKLVPSQIREAELISESWFILKVRDAQKKLKITPGSLVQEAKSPTAKIGRIVMFRYDPKTKESLKHYDTFPLVIPIHIYRDRMLGLNLHYLPPKVRAFVLNGLMKRKLRGGVDEKSRLLVTYKYLKRLSMFRFILPCIKQYLPNHIKGNVIHVDATEWNQVIFLNLERFKKESKQIVWKNSMRIAND